MDFEDSGYEHDKTRVSVGEKRTGPYFAGRKNGKSKTYYFCGSASCLTMSCTTGGGSTGLRPIVDGNKTSAPEFGESSNLAENENGRGDTFFLPILCDERFSRLLSDFQSCVGTNPANKWMPQMVNNEIEEAT